MKKILTALALFSNAFGSSTIVVANPHTDRIDNKPLPSIDKNKRHYNQDDEDSNRVEQRRLREERGVQRLKQHRWQTGYIMPQHYRGNGYKVEYRENNLPKPERNQQWYKVNNDYILVNSEEHDIIRILNF